MGGDDSGVAFVVLVVCLPVLALVLNLLQGIAVERRARRLGLEVSDRDDGLRFSGRYQGVTVEIAQTWVGHGKSGYHEVVARARLPDPRAVVGTAGPLLQPITQVEGWIEHRTSTALTPGSLERLVEDLVRTACHAAALREKL